MKQRIVFLAAFVALVITGYSRDAFSEFVITKVDPKFVSTPNPGGERSRVGDEKWLAVEVDFKSMAEEPEEVTFNYYLLLAGQLHVGEVTHVNVEKGRDLHSVMYVSPRTLKRIVGGKRFSPTQLENITVRISKKGQPVAERSIREFRAEWWKTLEAKTGSVLKKDQTPFTWVDWDYFEEIKSETRQ